MCEYGCARRITELWLVACLRVVVAAAESNVKHTVALRLPSERMKIYRYDFSCQERALRSIDFISSEC